MNNNPGQPIPAQGGLTSLTDLVTLVTQLQNQVAHVNGTNVELKEQQNQLEVQNEEFRKAYDELGAKTSAKIKALETKLKKQAAGTPSSENDNDDIQPTFKPLKIPLPDKYDGGQAELRGFLTKMKAYFYHYWAEVSTDEAKVRIMGQQLTGKALNWFEPMMRDYLENGEEERAEDTKKAFGSIDDFCTMLQDTFGNPDEEREAERRLAALKQLRSASEYAAEFRQVSSKLNWDDEPLMTVFYSGLKEDVKDEISKEDRPETLSEFITKAVRIDNRLYERFLVFCGFFFFGFCFCCFLFFVQDTKDHPPRQVRRGTG